MYEEFKREAEFLTIYIREAHPEDEWQMDDNVQQDVCYRQPQSLSDRLAIVKDFVQRFSYPIPIAVDTMADTADVTYGAWPERLYIVETDGTIAYKGGMGPYGYKPEEVREWLSRRFAERRGGVD